MISVVIPTYNRYEMLKRALSSVYTQTLQPSQVIVVDDGSTDNTLQIKNDFPKIIYYYQKNTGVSAARNMGIELSTCNWIAFLDSDDEWHKNKLKEQMAFHTLHVECKISYTDEKWIRDNKEVHIAKKFKKVNSNFFENFLSHCIVAPSSVLLHVDILNKYGNFDEELEVCEDYDLWLRVAQHEEFGLIDKKLITKYGGDKDQLSTKYWGMDRFRVKSLEKIYSTCKDERVVNELLKKLKLLYKGALKHKKEDLAITYRDKIEKYYVFKQKLSNNPL